MNTNKPPNQKKDATAIPRRGKNGFAKKADKPDKMQIAESIIELNKCLNHPNTRDMTIWSLGQIAGEGVSGNVDGLLKCGEYEKTRKTDAILIEDESEKEAINELRKFLVKSITRKEAIKMLEKVARQKINITIAADGLIKCLNYPYIRYDVAVTLGNTVLHGITSAPIIKGLVMCLCYNESGGLAHAALSGLDKIANGKFRKTVMHELDLLVTSDIYCAEADHNSEWFRDVSTLINSILKYMQENELGDTA